MAMSETSCGHLAGGGGGGYREGVCIVTHAKQYCLNATRFIPFSATPGRHIVVDPNNDAAHTRPKTPRRHTFGHCQTEAQWGGGGVGGSGAKTRL